MITASEFLKTAMNESDRSFGSATTGMFIGGPVGSVAGYVGKRDGDKGKNRMIHAAAGGALFGALSADGNRVTKLKKAGKYGVAMAAAYGAGRAWANSKKKKKGTLKKRKGKSNGNSK
jgi:uncharacterized membrane protein YebE (DUF533 family)